MNFCSAGILQEVNNHVNALQNTGAVYKFCCNFSFHMLHLHALGSHGALSTVIVCSRRK